MSHRQALDASRIGESNASEIVGVDADIPSCDAGRETLESVPNSIDPLLFFLSRIPIIVVQSMPSTERLYMLLSKVGDLAKIGEGGTDEEEEMSEEFAIGLIVEGEMSDRRGSLEGKDAILEYRVVHSARVQSLPREKISY